MSVNSPGGCAAREPTQNKSGGGSDPSRRCVKKLAPAAKTLTAPRNLLTLRD
jgi:hypothetical protein